MRALCWMGVNDLQVQTVPGPADRQPARRDPQGDADDDLRLGPAPARRIRPDDARGRRHRPRVHGRGRRGRPRDEAQAGRPRRRAVVPRLRQVLVLRPRRVVAVRQHASQARARRAGARLPDRRHPGLQPRLRRLRRLACGVHPRAARRRQLLPGARGGHRRAGAVPLRRGADRLHGRGLLRDPAGRHRRRLGLRRRRPDGPAQRVPHGRRARHRHRPPARAPGARPRQGRGRRRSTTPTPTACSRSCAS